MKKNKKELSRMLAFLGIDRKKVEALRPPEPEKDPKESPERKYLRILVSQRLPEKKL